MANAAIPRIFVIGESASGKTALLMRLANDPFSATTASTALLDSRPVLIEGREASFVETRNLQLAELKETIQTQPLCVIVAIDASREITDAVLSHWREEVRSAGFPDSSPTVLVPCKVDTRRLDESLASAARALGFSKCFPTSALTGHGVPQLANFLNESIKWPQVADEDPARQAVYLAVRDLTETLCRLVAANPKALDYLEWRQLEHIVATATAALGFAVELTPGSKDGGRDVVLSRQFEGRKEIYYIEVKHWRAGKRVGARELQSFIQVNVRDSVTGGLFLSTSGYSHEVHSRLAEVTHMNVHLGSAKKVIALCQQFVRVRDSNWLPQCPIATLLQESTVSTEDGDA